MKIHNYGNDYVQLAKIEREANHVDNETDQQGAESVESTGNAEATGEAETQKKKAKERKKE